MKSILSVLLIASALLISGCQEEEQKVVAPPPPPKPKTGSIAVFDINKVAREVGLSSEIERKKKARDKRLGQELKEFQITLRAELQAEVKKLKKKEIRLKAPLLQRAAMAQFEVAKRRAAAISKSYHLKLAAKAREQIRPVAQEVYKKKEYRVLLLKNETVVYDFDDRVDLTSDVVEAYRLKFPEGEDVLKSAIEPEETASVKPKKKKSLVSMLPKKLNKKSKKKTKAKKKPRRKVVRKKPKPKPAAKPKPTKPGEEPRLKLKFQEGAQQAR